MTASILSRILEYKRLEVEQRKARRTQEMLREFAESAAPTRGFAQALANESPAVVAEIKKASPSKGVIRENFDPAGIATSYYEGGATCLSVLTDQHFFQGDDEYLIQARDTVPLPILRKDFVVDQYQIFEARVIGADCVLLIAAALDPRTMSELYEAAISIGLDVLIEIHNAAELDTAIALEPSLIGINNRDLESFETNLDTTLELLDRIPKTIQVVTESGIQTRSDVERLRRAGVDAFLVGEAFMRAEDPGKQIKTLFS
ncbi:MAG: indole-3-glycerol phosphate synthase TrpC [Pseudomonadales bacterium]